MQIGKDWRLTGCGVSGERRSDVIHSWTMAVAVAVAVLSSLTYLILVSCLPTCALPSLREQTGELGMLILTY